MKRTSVGTRFCASASAKLFAVDAQKRVPTDILNNIVLFVLILSAQTIAAQSIEAFRPYLPSERTTLMFDRMVEFEKEFDDALAIMSYDVDSLGVRQYQLQLSYPLTHPSYTADYIKENFEPIHQAVDSLHRSPRTADVKYNYTATGGARRLVDTGEFVSNGSSHALVVTHNDGEEKFASEIDNIDNPAVMASLTWTQPGSAHFKPAQTSSLETFFKHLPQSTGNTAWKKKPSLQEWSELLELFYDHIGTDEFISLEYSRTTRSITLHDHSRHKTYEAHVKDHTLYMTITTE